MNTVSIHEAKTHLSALVSRVENLRAPVIICRHGHAVAEIVPLPKGNRTKPSERLKNIELHYDPTEPTEGEWGDV